MTSPRSLLYWFFLPVFCLCFLSACRGEGDQATVRKAEGASEQFGEPKFTPEVHFLAGQVHESKITAPTPNGKPLSSAEVVRFQAAALNQYAAALKLDSNHSPSLYRSAIVFGDMKRYEQATAMWQRYADAVGRTPDSLVNLGIACEMANRLDDAETAYREATRRDPQHTAAHVNLGVLLARQGQVKPAQVALSQVLEPAAVHWHLGAGLAAGGHQHEAEQQFRTAVQLDPNFASRPVREAGRTARVE